LQFVIVNWITLLPNSVHSEQNPIEFILIFKEMFFKSSWNSLFKNEGNPFAFKRPSRKWSLIKILPIIPTLFQPYITLKNCVVYGLLDSHVIKHEYFFDYLDYISLHLSTKCFVKIVNRYLFGLKTNRKMLSCVAYQSVINTGHVENVIWWMMSIGWKCLPYDCKWEIPNAQNQIFGYLLMGFARNATIWWLFFHFAVVQKLHQPGESY